MILNRSELITKLSNKFKSFTSSDIDYSVKKILEHISKSLYSGDRIEIRGFGTFSKKLIRPRKFINPKTKEVSYLGETSTMHFKPSKSLVKK